MKLKYAFLLVLCLTIMGFSLPWPLSAIFQPSTSHYGNYSGGFGAKSNYSSLLNPSIYSIHAQASNLNTQVLQLALKAYTNAKAKVHANDIITIIDYSKPSTERRMWVIDLRTQKVLYNTWVTHGRNSGGLSAISFSNQPGSLKSSVGLFLTESTYVGHVGYSLHLRGLENGFNDNAYRRSVVIHGAWYANPEVAQRYGQLGRSWGCPAISDKIAKPLIDTIKNNSLVFIYYPDKLWLNHSRYLV